MLAPWFRFSTQFDAFASVWNHFIPSSAVSVKLSVGYVHYLHPRKGWKRVSLRRFANWRPVVIDLLARAERS
jgi:hypothetical protein